MVWFLVNIERNQWGTGYYLGCHQIFMDEAGASEQVMVQVILSPFDNSYVTWSQIINSIQSHDYLEIGRTRVRAMKRGPVTIDSERAKNILPLSSRTFSLKQSKEDEFRFETISAADEAKSAVDNSNVRKWYADAKETTSFIKLLRLSQMLLSAHLNRSTVKSQGGSHANPEFIITEVLKDSLDILENYVDDESSKEELEGHYVKLEAYVDGRLREFNARFETETGTNPNITLRLDEIFFDHFINVPDVDQINPKDYKFQSTRDDILDLQRQVMHNAIKSLFALKRPAHKSIALAMPTLPINLELDQSTSTPYDAVLTLANQMLPAISAEEAAQKEIKVVLAICEERITLKSLLNHPPAALIEKLDNIMSKHNLEEVMEQQLIQSISEVLEHQKEQGYGIKEIYRASGQLRRKLTNLTHKMQSLYDDIEALRAGKDAKSDYEELNTKWVTENTSLSAVGTTKASIETALKSLAKVEIGIHRLSSLLKNKKSNISTDGSVLWLGLGQAGSQILRECLLYCLDNLNDARCSALVRGLGIHDQKRFKQNLLNRKHINPQVRENAELDLKSMCDQNLHILAMNLGGEVDDLVASGAPGSFLWGDSVTESEHSSVRRKAMNTLKLDQDQDGAGGKTGMGRAYGFARQSEILETLNEVGRKGGRSPNHVIVTHSYAGGSGSGMVLPVLQMLRMQFDSETMIWVISVGKGASEAKVSADFNTPFIISDVLQAHYDGIHSPMNPFTLGDWRSTVFALGDLYNEMESSLLELSKLLGWSEAEPFMETLLKSLGGHIPNKTRRKKNFDLLISSPIYNEQKRLEPSDVDAMPGVPELLQMLPNDEEETDAFNTWCSDFDDMGRRPATKFWYKWVECMSDPIGTFIIAKDQSKKTASSSDEDDHAFAPNITLAHLELMLKTIKQIVPTASQDRDAGKKLKVLEQEMKILMNPLVAHLNQETIENQKVIFENIQEVFNAYSMKLENFNKIRRDLTKRVQALSKSSNDIGIKNIIISNAHLERGVKGSGIPVEEATYTVYNAVVFDLIMNIIGSQLPSEDYISGKMEYFDRQDLSNHTKPPMVVGLMELSDSESLGETFHADGNLQTSQEVSDAYANIFVSKTVDGEIPNPFMAKDFEIAGGPIYLMNSLFGVRMEYMLQHNPYTLMGQAEPEKLIELTDLISKGWNDDRSSLFKLSLAQRQNLNSQGFTRLHFVNMLRWLTTIDKDTLNSNILGGPTLDHLEGYRPSTPPQLELQVLRTSVEISKYAKDSGRVNLNSLENVLPQLGIWTEEVLAAMSPSYLHSFLVSCYLGEASKNLKMKEKNSDLEDWEKTAEYIIGILSEYFQPSTSYGNSNPDLREQLFGIDWRGRDDFNRTQSYLADYDLSLKYVLPPSDSDDDELLVLRLHPKMHRYLSVIRDATSGPYAKVLPSQSLAGSVARYMSPDSQSDVIGQYSSPKFKKALDKLNRLRYVGLLPGEQRLELSAFLRVLLLNAADGVSDVTTALHHVAEANEINLDDYASSISAVMESNPFETSHFTLYDEPRSVVMQAAVMRQRMLDSKPFFETYSASNPESKQAKTYWFELLERIEDIPLDSEEQLRYFLQNLQASVQNSDLILDESAQDRPPLDEEQDELAGGSEEAAVNDVESSNSENSTATSQETVLLLRRLVFDVATVLNEALTQSEYMSKSHSTERVHFQMSGFSDRIIGVPSGLLIQVHTNSSSRGDVDTYRSALRGSIYASIGTVKDTKEFFTKSHFGPAASITTTLQQAPVNEAAAHYRAVMKHLSGKDPDSYLEKTKLHPYVFLYNILWLSARVEKWTDNENVGFARKFIIPTSVIQKHYTDPDNIKGATDILVTDAVFQSGIEVPQGDIRDYESCKNLNETYRSMYRLISIMAYRHKLALNDPTFNADYEAQIKEMEKDKLLVKIAKGLPSEALDTPEKTTGNSGKPAGKLSFLEQLKAKSNPGGKATEDTLKGRAMEWMKAYDAWKSFGNTEASEESESLGYV
jgi:hypothetical protein